MPRPGPDQLVVQVHSCGICGSDIHQLRDGWGFKPGAVAGHEWSGTIAAIGDDVTEWSVGEVVVGGSWPRCGTCRRCLEGKPSQCENRSDMIADSSRRCLRRVHPVRAAGVLRLPDGLSARHAALAEPLAVALHGITRSGGARATASWSSAPGQSARSSVAAFLAHGDRPTSRWWSPSRGAAPGGRSGRPRSSTLRSSRSSRPGSPRSMSSRAVARRPRVLGPRSGHRGRLPPAGPGRHAWSWWGRASSTRPSTPTA